VIVLSNIQKLYDGSSATQQAVLQGVDLVLDGERIKALHPHGVEDYGESVARIDCSAYTVTPGLIDCHSHVSILGIGKEEMELANGPSALVWIEKILHATLVEGGVTSLRDVGGATDLVKRLVNEGAIIGPRLKISICMLSSTGGHADFRGPDRCHGEISKLWGEGPGRPPSIVDGPWECRKRVREIAACGADLIKLCTSPGVASPSDHLEHQDFSAEEIIAICTEAEARGLKVAAHAHSKAGIELAIKHGVHDIQHASFLDERLVEMAAAKGCTITPTSWVVQDLPRSRGLDPFVMEKAKQVAEVHQAAVEHARSGDLRILGGTDPVLPGMHGRNYMELVALMADGLDPLQAWHGMTGLAAEEIGFDDTGCLREGARADLLICQDDPIEDPRLLDVGALVEVVKDGVAYRGGLEGLPQRRYRDGAREPWRVRPEPRS
jgi:imidazolonepropionase-like amidohydrolase